DQLRQWHLLQSLVEFILLFHIEGKFGRLINDQFECWQKQTEAADSMMPSTASNANFTEAVRLRRGFEQGEDLLALG
ncbi:MAG TPA: hypothetical protein PKM58_09300, partial [Pyrinomonadaceae bacterium]|nr:hypothetical protein [Pyrinomonadaceae bacterium]